ncbi:MAG: acyl-CoA synthetase FdrA, partial [Anaerolineales bacterium]
NPGFSFANDDIAGVADAGVVMATPANLDLLRESELLPEAIRAGAEDLLIVVKAEDEAAARQALSQVDTLLQRRSSAVDQAFAPKSLSGAMKMAPDSDWVLISVPGKYAAQVARESLALGLHVFLYSDNVSIEDEVALKSEALAAGRLVMGPDCGTAIVHGVGLGFANRVRRGAVGVVAASGTGLQAFSSQLHALGGGISQALGTGSHDMSGRVRGVTTLQALAYLAADEATEVIVLISKPPDPDLAAQVLSAARGSGKPTVIYFLGYAAPGRILGNLHFAASLEEASELAHGLAQSTTDRPAPDRAALRPSGQIRGLFSGGTLAAEFLQTLQALVYPIYSNVPLHPTQLLENPLHSREHTILDLGDDQFTVGRLHPMLDNDLRIRRMRQEAADPSVGVIVLDVVLGMGSHPDPASELGPAMEAAIRLRPALVFGVILVGTDEDPQGRSVQEERLRAAGAQVFTSVRKLAEFAADHADASPVSTGVVPELTAPLQAVNIGLVSFFESLVAQGAQAIHVDWRPPAGGDQDLMEILARLGA